MPMHWSDRIVSVFSPHRALVRDRTRSVLSSGDPFRDPRNDALPGRGARHGRTGPNDLTARVADAVRDEARMLEHTSDLAAGILDTLVDNTVGAGIVIEPAVRTIDGNPHNAMSNAIIDLWNDWELHSDVTGELHFDELQRIAARSMYRDGETLARKHAGRLPGVAHTERYPFALEPLEADHLERGFNDESLGIVESIERNGWGAPRAYWLLDAHPGEGMTLAKSRERRRRVSADTVLHARLQSRFEQRRGVSLFATAIDRLEDIAEIEAAERKSAKVAAYLAAYVKREIPDVGLPAMGSSHADGQRDFDFGPDVMFFDQLAPGESVGTIDSSRPNNELIPFRASQLKAVAAGTGTSYSTIARDYSGTYSSQRQALVESYQHYRALSRLFILRYVQPIYRAWLDTMLLTQTLQLPVDVDRATLYRAEMRGPAMPWIDPVKEANGEILQIGAGLKSRSQSIRERGGYPREVLDQIKRERERDAKEHLDFTSTAPPPGGTPQETKAMDVDPDDDDDNETVVNIPNRSRAAGVYSQRDGKTDAPQLQFRDMRLEGSPVVDEDKRLVRMSFSSEAPVLRQPFFEQPYMETLGHQADEVDLTRLNAGAALLYNHDDRDRANRIGAVQRAWLEGDRGHCEVQLSKREDVDDIWQDLKDGLLRNVSVGYRVDKARAVKPADSTTGEPAQFRATSWTPVEISLVTIPADATVGVGRAYAATGAASLPEDTKMSDDSTVTQRAEPSQAPASTIALADHEAALTRAAEQAATRTLDLDRARRADIRQRLSPFAASLTEMESDLLERCLEDNAVDGATAGERMLELLATRSADGPINRGVVETGDDQRDKTRAAMTLALEHRARIVTHDLQGNPFASCSLREMARESLRACNESTAYSDVRQLIGRAMTTSDFPTLLADTAHKSVIAGFTEAASEYRQICHVVDLNDFRQTETADLGAYDDLSLIPEDGEYHYHGFSSGGEAMQLATFGSIFSISRQAVINDNASIIGSVPRKQGIAVVRLHTESCFNVLLEKRQDKDGNLVAAPVLKDGKKLFHADHKNLAATGAPLSVETLAAGQLAMVTQKGPKGARGDLNKKVLLNIRPTILVVPEGMRIAANQLMNSANDPANLNVANPVAGLYAVVADPRLDDADPDAWYLLAAPNTEGGIGLGLLGGNDQPFTDERQGWTVDGLEMKVRTDVVAHPTNYRAMYKNPGV